MFWEWMFLDSGNIISDETFCTKSQNYGGKSSQIFGRKSQLSSSNWCHMIQKGHVTPTATSYHPLTKAERFCRKFGNFFHHNFDSVYRMSHHKVMLCKDPCQLLHKAERTGWSGAQWSMLPLFCTISATL